MNEDAFDDADGLSPPEEVADLHDDFIETLRIVLDSLKEFADELDDVDSFEELESLFEDFEFEGVEAAEDACLALEQAAEDNGITGYVASTGRSYICPEVKKDPRYLPGIVEAQSSLTVPLRLQNEVLGVLNVESHQSAAFTEDGWLKTGDVGEWVDGTHLKIIDRISDVIITSGGENISPSEIENRLKTSPYVKEAMVIGDRRKYVTALIAIEYDVVGNWALAKSIPYTTYRDLSKKPEVVDLIQKVVNDTNEKFARVEQIKKFRMIPKELDHEDGELTATQKIKRNAVENMFGELISDMYE